MAEITIPGFICEIKEEDKVELEALLHKFGNARRRAYSMMQHGIQKSFIEKQLQEETGLNSRYIKDAYHSIKDLPPHVTFGGLKNQRLREEGKITAEEYRKRRDSILISRGDRSKKGNLNLRLNLETSELRITTVSGRKWIYPKVYIPNKYLLKYGHLLDGSIPYTVLIKRRNNDNGYDVRITVEASVDVEEGKRVMTLDINAGHIDFAIMNKGKGDLVAVGKINAHETQFVKTSKRDSLLHKTTDEIGNIAKHYNADVIVGKLNTGKFKSKNKRANRKIKNIPQFKFRKMLRKLNRRGIVVKERSEAYTTKVGKIIAPLIGLDVHKASAIAFGIKVTDFNNLWQKLLSLVPADEGDGSQSRRRRRGSGLTVPYQSDLVSDETKMKSGGYPMIPGNWGLSLRDRLKTDFVYLPVEIY